MASFILVFDGQMLKASFQRLGRHGDIIDELEGIEEAEE